MLWYGGWRSREIIRNQTIGKISHSRQFIIIDEDVKARRTLYKLTQTSSVQNYISEFTRLSFLIPDLEEREKFHRFKEGLKPEIRNEMDKRGITRNLPILQSQAQKYDEILFSQW